MACIMGRDRKKEVFWRRVMGAQPRSGMSVRAWCQEHGLRESSFYGWRRQLALRDEAPRATTLVPVRVVAERDGDRRDEGQVPAASYRLMDVENTVSEDQIMREAVQRAVSPHREMLSEVVGRAVLRSSAETLHSAACLVDSPASGADKPAAEVASCFSTSSAERLCRAPPRGAPPGTPSTTSRFIKLSLHLAWARVHSLGTVLQPSPVGNQ